MSKYIEKYPWLRLMNLYTGKIDTQCDAMDDMPVGWEIAFGELLCEELDNAIKKADLIDKFVVLQVKEKFGALRFVVNHHNDEIDKIIAKYEHISRNTCIVCGKPDTPILNTTWIHPLCKECYVETPCDETYESVVMDSGEISVLMTYETFAKNKHTVSTIDLSDTVKKIRDRWNARNER